MRETEKEGWVLSRFRWRFVLFEVRFFCFAGDCDSGVRWVGSDEATKDDS